MRKGFSSAKAIAAGGICSALSLVLLLISAFIPTVTISFSALAGLPVAYAVLYYGKKSGLFVYAVSAILGLILLPDKSAAMMYLMLFGAYPVIKAVIERIGRVAYEWIIKLAFALASFSLMFFALKVVFTLPPIISGNLAKLYLVFAAAFVLYDIVLSMLIAEMAARLGRK